MKKYEFTNIEMDKGIIAIVSTSEAVILWVEEQVRNLHPDTKVVEPDVYKKFPRTANLGRVFQNLNYQEHSIGLYLIQELCENGWEPFGEMASVGVMVSRIAMRRSLD